MQRGVWQQQHDRRAPLLQPPSPSSPSSPSPSSSPLRMPAGSGFSNGILGSPRGRRSSHAAKSGGDVASVYVTINPDASGCSALLLLIGTRLFQQPLCFCISLSRIMNIFCCRLLSRRSD